MTYSVAIRTLGTNPDTLKLEIESIFRQSYQPQKVIVYIAEGYNRPAFEIQTEQYVWVKKGMLTQRALKYDEIESDCILMLDDDVLLEKDAVKNLMNAMEEYGADCVGADIFRNQDMKVSKKVFAAISNLVFPHWSKKWAFRVHSHGSSSYNNNPRYKGFYWSESCGGPISLWKKNAFLRLHMEDEVWMDQLGFPYDEDKLTFYKLVSNGGKLGILYDAGVTNLDGKTSSGDYHKNMRKYYIRSFMAIANWHRIIWSTRTSISNHVWAAFAICFKVIWLFFVNIIAGLFLWNYNVPLNYLLGCIDAIRFIQSDTYKNLPSFVLR